MKTYSARVLSGCILGAAVVAVATWVPSAVCCLMLVVIVVVAQWEFYRLLKLGGIPSFKFIGCLSGVLLIVASWLSFQFDATVLSAEWEILVLVMVVMAVLLRQLQQKQNGYSLAPVAYTLLGVLYVPFLFNFLTKLVFAWDSPGWYGGIGPTGRWLFFYLIAVVKCADIGAFLFGTLFGRHKLIPRISPGKTWEGCLGGIIMGVVVSLVFFKTCNGQLGYVSLRLGDAVLLGIVLPIIGVLGDLIESMLKRTAGAKDSGRIIPGMGGMLDVLDSLLFAVPVFYLYVRYVLVITA